MKQHCSKGKQLLLAIPIPPFSASLQGLQISSTLWPRFKSFHLFLSPTKPQHHRFFPFSFSPLPQPHLPSWPPRLVFPPHKTPRISPQEEAYSALHASVFREHTYFCFTQFLIKDNVPVILTKYLFVTCLVEFVPKETKAQLTRCIIPWLH